MNNLNIKEINSFIPYLYKMSRVFHYETSKIERMDGSLPEDWEDISQEAQEASVIVLGSLFLFFKTYGSFKAISPEVLHGVWMHQKETLGWSYGESYDLQTKTHPSMVSFDRLSYKDQHKDIIWSGLFFMIYSDMLKLYLNCSSSFRTEFEEIIIQKRSIYNYLLKLV